MLVFVQRWYLFHVFLFKFCFFSQRRKVQTMADNAGSTSSTERTSLADSSIFDSKVTETSKENLFIGSTSYVEGKSLICFQAPNCYFNPKLPV